MPAGEEYEKGVLLPAEMNMDRICRGLLTSMVAMFVLAGTLIADNGDTKILILTWHPDQNGLIQTYTAEGARNGPPIAPPPIPAGGLTATMVATLGDVYRVQIGDVVVYVRDASVGESKVSSNTCSASGSQNGEAARKVVGVAVHCPHP